VFGGKKIGILKCGRTLGEKKKKKKKKTHQKEGTPPGGQGKTFAVGIRTRFLGGNRVEASTQVAGKRKVKIGGFKGTSEKWGRLRGGKKLSSQSSILEQESAKNGR